MGSDTSFSRWNADISYVFSIHKTGMGMIGTWPLQVNDFPSKVRWTVVVVAGICLTSSQVIEVLFDRGRTYATLEAFMMAESSGIALLKQVIVRIYLEKLKTNVDSATDDWLYFRTNEGSLKVMRKYAQKARGLIILILSSLNACYGFYICGTLMLIREQKLLDNLNRNNASNMQMQRPFPLSSTWLNDKLNNSQYLGIVAFQLVIVSMMIISQCLIDSFFLNIVVHLSGQLELLKKEFRNFHVNPGSEVHQRKRLGALVERHCWLRKLAQNLQDTFNVVIFLEAGLTAILIALSGVRSIENIKQRNFSDLIRSISVMIYLGIHCCLYLCGGDILLTESEGIFYSIFETSWYQLSPGITRDLTFVMLRTKTPLSLNGGKLFHISRGTMIHIFQLAGSYISLLQAVVKD